MEDERYDELMWDKYEDENRWTGWQGRYSKRYDPYFESLNRLNASSERGRNQYSGDTLNFESENRGPYTASQGNQQNEQASRRGSNWQRSPGPYVGLGPRSYKRTDERIWEDVCERLTRHGWIDASNIEVKVQNGEVSLQGTVDNRQVKRMVEDLAESVYGVNEVNNRLRVSG